MAMQPLAKVGTQGMLLAPLLLGRDAMPVVLAEDCIMGVREKVELVCKGVINGCFWDGM